MNVALLAQDPGLLGLLCAERPAAGTWSIQAQSDAWPAGSDIVVVVGSEDAETIRLDSGVKSQTLVRYAFRLTRKRCAGGRVPDGSRAMAAGITLSSRRSWPTWLMGATPPSQVRACAGAVRRAAGSGTPNSARDINPSCSYPRKGHFGAA